MQSRVPCGMMGHMGRKMLRNRIGAGLAYAAAALAVCEAIRALLTGRALFRYEWAAALLLVPLLAVPVAFLAIIGTVNGANFTDGLDGLASSVTLLIATFFSVVAVGTQSGLHPITCAVVGSLMGFLLFNVYPASVFMGDTGSLALGGFVAATAYMMDMPIFILIVALIYWVEILSVMIQVTYFKLSGGKRIFRMAPIHHHFELGGWSETRVVAVFSIVTALLCLVGILAL